jgi:hypothetical protein
MTDTLESLSLAAFGLIVLPGSVQEAHASPCADNEIEVGGGGSDFNDSESDNEAEVGCEFYGPTDIEE